MQKPILDATCGFRGMWFNKHNPAALYVDKREVPPMKVQNGRNFECLPDITADFCNLPFEDRSFKLVVFDPPHVKGLSQKSALGIRFGSLPEDWEVLIHAGFWECMRVLDNYGTLIFKWSEIQIPTRKVIDVIGAEPLFGHISGRKSNTHWMTFMKMPGREKE